MKQIAIRLIQASTKVVLVLIIVASSVFGQSKIIDTEVIKTNDGTRNYIIAKSLTIQPLSPSQGVVFTATPTVSYVMRMANPDQQYFPPSMDQNFVRTETILVNGITDETAIKTLTVNQKNTSYEYVDGLGRKLQSVIWKGSPLQNDVITPYEFDQFGRMAKEYLPFSAYQSNGAYRTTGLGDIGNFYSTPPAGVAQDTRPFKENIFEASPLNRITDIYGPGIDWKNGTVNKGVKSLFKVNQALENITRWKYYVGGVPEKDGVYPDNHLSVQETTDEEGQVTKVYTDGRGLVVLNRVGAGTNWFDTQYIYSPTGLLMIVIQPEGVARLATEFDAGGANKQSFLNRWCFMYQYDDEQRMVAKRIPGWEPNHWAYTIYDQWNRVILTQTPAQKTGNAWVAANQWTFNKYDRFNRVIMTGLFTSASDRATIQAAVNTHYSNVNNRFETELNNATGYTQDKNYPVNVAETALISVTYYDNYAFLGYTGWEAAAEGTNSNYNFVNVAGFPQNTELLMSVKGYATGSKARVLGQTQWLNSATYYDKKYRLIQVIAQNYVGGRDRITSQYDFVGKTLKTQTYHTATGSTLTALREFEYDHFGRLVKLYQTTDSGTRTLLASTKYNEIGQLIEKNIHSTDNGVTFLQSIDMRYNIRGWLTSINNSSLTNDGATNNDANDIFGMELLYNPTIQPTISGYTPTADNKVPKLYNGNITAIKWKADTKQPGLTPKERIYGFDYDALNRLKKAYYAANNAGTWTADVGLFNEGINAYDKNGNISGIQRQGKINGATATIDNTTYGYNYAGAIANFTGLSNRLLSVSDAGNAYGFKDAAAQVAEEYKYDASGNLIFDHNKAISNIKYNHLNLPEIIEFTPSLNVKDRIIYTYDPSGTKLRMEVYKNGTASTNGTLVWTTDYVGEIQYDKNGSGAKTLSFAATPEGRVVKNSTGYDYEYFYKDHQGNVRLTYGNLKETLSYRATMENPAAPSTLGNDENSTFKNIASTRTANATFNFTKPSDQTLVPDKAALTNGHATVNKPIGPAKSLLLGAGDKVKMEVIARYSQATGSTATIAASALVTALATTTFGFSAGETGYTSFNNNAPGIPGIPGSGSATVPKAYLAYIFFNTSYQFVPSGSGAISITTSAFNAFEKLERSFTAPQAGYLYVYVANESNTSTGNVYFDEMLIVHQKASSTLQVTQASDYYPFGLAFNAYQAERINENLTPVQKNRYGFQGQEFQSDLDLGWSQFKWRMHDPAIGRFGGVDLLSDKYSHNSTYAFSENKLTNGVELEGLEHVYTIHSATISDSFKAAVESGQIYEQRRIMAYANETKFTSNDAYNMTFFDEHKPVNNQVLSYKYDPTFEGVIVNTTSNVNGTLIQDDISFGFTRFSDGSMYDKNYPTDVHPKEGYFGNDFSGNLLGGFLDGGEGALRGGAKGYGRIRGFGFVQYNLELSSTNPLDIGFLSGIIYGNFSGKLSESFTNLFGPSLVGKDGKFSGNNWSLNMQVKDFNIFKSQEILKNFTHSNMSLGFYKLDGYKQDWYYTFRR